MIGSARNEQQHYPERTGFALQTERHCARLRHAFDVFGITLIGALIAGASGFDKPHKEPPKARRRFQRLPESGNFAFVEDQGERWNRP